MSKVFAFSTRVRRRGSQCCTARLISGNGCSGNEVGQKHPHISVTSDRLAWKMNMGRTYTAVPSALQVVTSMNEASLLAAAKNGETAVLDTLYRAHGEKLLAKSEIIRNRRKTMSKKLEGKIALVRGGSRGIGAAIAKRLAADGANVAITYTKGADAAAAVVKEIERGGRKAIAIQAAPRE